MKPITDPRDVPQDLNDEEQIEFWETHRVTEDFLSKVEEVPEEARPRRHPRAKLISVRFDESILERLKNVAEIKGVGYQTLLKEFVSERLYEEEKREGIITLNTPARTSSASTSVTVEEVRQLLESSIESGFHEALEALGKTRSTGG